MEKKSIDIFDINHQIDFYSLLNTLSNKIVHALYDTIFRPKEYINEFKSIDKESDS